MRFHTLGKDLSSDWGTSLAVLQFVELARGVRRVQAPANPFRVVEMRREELYCLHCFGTYSFDVIYGFQQAAFSGLMLRVKRCRNCGKESRG
jgi:hypothetical protein